MVTDRIGAHVMQHILTNRADEYQLRVDKIRQSDGSIKEEWILHEAGALTFLWQYFYQEYKDQFQFVTLPLVHIKVLLEEVLHIDPNSLPDVSALHLLITQRIQNSQSPLLKRGCKSTAAETEARRQNKMLDVSEKDESFASSIIHLKECEVLVIPSVLQFPRSDYTTRQW
jgi:hypothetical protein